MISLPDWFQGYRDNQLPTIAKIIEEFKTSDLVVLDAPTGSGKTLIAESVRQLGKFRRTLYVCNTKTLQDQFMRDFEYAKLLKGRGNYEVLYPPSDWMKVTADDCLAEGGEKPECKWCGIKWACPYEIAKKEALGAPLAVLNTSYFLTECNGPGRFNGADLVIADEADTLENELMGFVSVELTAKRVQELGIGTPEKVTKEDSWAEWAENSYERVSEIVGKLPVIFDPENVKESRRRKLLARVKRDLSNLKVGLRDGGYVYTGRDGAVSFKPVKVDAVGSRYLWQHGKKWLLMSATVISPSEMVESLGYTGSWSFVEMGSSFPVENRQVKIIPVADMSKKADEKEKAVKAIQEIINRHPQERTLIHTVSYDLGRSISSNIRERPVFYYSNGRERDDCLQRFLASENGVLVASSMDRGVDLPDDLCRVVIVAKCPFGNLGDRQTSARLFGTRGGQTWYAVNTIRSIVQMCGRGVRHKDDYAVTYIVDKQFLRLWNDNRGLFPKWWTEALDWRDNVRV